MPGKRKGEKWALSFLLLGSPYFWESFFFGSLLGWINERLASKGTGGIFMVNAY